MKNRRRDRAAERLAARRRRHKGTASEGLRPPGSMNPRNGT